MFAASRLPTDLPSAEAEQQVGAGWVSVAAQGAAAQKHLAPAALAPPPPHLW